jgi:hypothetical protein
MPAFSEIVAADTEFTALPGERQVPVGIVAHELRSGYRYRYFQGEFPSSPPWATGPDVLLVTFVANAETECFLKLGWKVPNLVLDLFAEFVVHTNGKIITIPDREERKWEKKFKRNSLMNALRYFGWTHPVPLKTRKCRKPSALIHFTGDIHQKRSSITVKMMYLGSSSCFWRWPL